MHPELSIYKYSNEEEEDLYIEEQMMYGSSRLGSVILKEKFETPPSQVIYVQKRGQKRYELNNHLGNVLTTVSDRRKLNCLDTVYEADIINTWDYSPFGAPLHGRHTNTARCTDYLVHQSFYVVDDNFNGVGPVSLTSSASSGTLYYYELTSDTDGEIDNDYLSIGATGNPVTNNLRGVAKTFTVVSGKTYNIKFRHNRGTCEDPQGQQGQAGDYEVNIYDDSNNNLIAGPFSFTHPSGGWDTFNETGAFTAAANGTYRIEITRTSQIDDVCAFLIDDVQIWYEDDVPHTYCIPVDGYRFGFNGQQKDDEVYGDNNAYDFGARVYDGRLGRWFKGDPKEMDYPYLSTYCFVANTPINAIDPDGRLILFVNGLRLWKGNADQTRLLGGGGIYREQEAGKLRSYWKGKNTFGRDVDMAEQFMSRIGDRNSYFTSGSSHWNSQAKDRYKDGVSKANKFDRMVKNGKITLEDGESIKIVTHSQGAAHGNGMADRLIELGYKVEVIYNITPHQPTDITSPDKVRGVQYSHPGDAVSSDDPWWLPNGGSDFGRIKGIDEFDGREIMGSEGQPKCEGPGGNRCGHNVEDNDFIFDIPKKEDGFVSPRKDKPKN